MKEKKCQTKKDERKTVYNRLNGFRPKFTHQDRRAKVRLITPGRGTSSWSSQREYRSVELLETDVLHSPDEG